jgi:putative oxidoreductase
MRTIPVDNATASSREDLGRLVLRVTLAVLLLFHGVSKLMGGVGFITGMLEKMGLPAGIGYLVYVGEVIAPLLILFGVWTRLAALIVAGNMIVAILLVHTKQFLTMSESGGWALELQGMYFFAAIALALLGAGRYSIGGRVGKWN